MPKQIPQSDQLNASVELLKPTEGQTSRRFATVAYTGAPVERWYGTLVVDLDSTQMRDGVGALLDHSPMKRAGVGNLTRTDKGIEFAGKFLSNDYAKEILADADDGFPWEMSIRPEWGRLEQVKDGVEVEVNGLKLKGPLYVARDNKIREVSFVALGADGETSAEVFNNEGNEMPYEALQQQLDEALSAKTQLQKENERLTGENEALKLAAQEQKDAARKGEIAELLRALGKDDNDPLREKLEKMSDEAYEGFTTALKLSTPAHAAPQSDQLFNGEQGSETLTDDAYEAAEKAAMASIQAHYKGDV